MWGVRKRMSGQEEWVKRVGKGSLGLVADMGACDAICSQGATAAAIAAAPVPGSVEIWL
jgi:hypothetical protein